MPNKPKPTPHGAKTPAASQTTPASSASPRSADDHAEFAGMSILIVDDNPQNVELLQAYLESLPCVTRTASNGTDALASVAAALPDLVLLDVMMPRMSGFEVCRKLKANPATRDIPVIMVTALNEVGDVERGAESGTDDFLSKPFNKLELLTRVKLQLRTRKSRRIPNRAAARPEPAVRADLDQQTRVEE